MRRRHFLRTATFGVTSLTLPGSGEAYGKVSSRSRKPNILWICSDQQRWDTIHALGNKQIKTPNIDRLVKEGTSFTKAHCISPICTPSRAAFLTGMYPSAVGGCKNGAAYWPEKAPLVTKLLKDAGYVCGLSGKLHLSGAMVNNPEKRPKDDGYSEFHYSHGPNQGGDKNDYLTWLKKQGQTYRNVKKFPWKKQAPLHQTTWCCERAMDFMKKNRGKPWLFSVNMFDPHAPLDPPPDYVKRYDIDSLRLPLWKDSDVKEKSVFNAIFFQGKPKKWDPRKARTTIAKYWAMCELIDENVGRLLKCLKETGQLDNTVIIYTSDHGDMMGDHGMMYKGCRFYDGLMRVPLIFWAPGTFKRNLKSDALVDLMDIAPTLLQLTGQKIPKRMQGKSLLPILTGKARPGFHKKHLRMEYYACLGPAKGSKGWPENRATMIRTEEYKLTVYHDHKKGELFDIKKDPGEFRNLWDSGKHTRVRNELVKLAYAETLRAMEKSDTEVRTALAACKSPAELSEKFNAFVFSIDAGPERTGRY